MDIKNTFHRPTAESALMTIIVVLSAARLLLFWINPAYSWDEAAYLDIADGLTNGLQYGWVTPTFHDVAFRPPLLPYTIWAVYSVFGVNELAAKAITPIISVASIVVVYYLGKMIADRKFGLIAAAALAANPANLFFSYRVMLENYLGLLVALDMLLLLMSFRDKRMLVLLGITVALGAITRYSGLIFIPAALVAMFIFKREELVKTLKSPWLLAGFAASLAVLTPWFMQNMNQYGSPIGAAQEHASYITSLSPLFGHYLVYWMPLVGFLVPFALWGFVKCRHNKTIGMVAVIILVLLVGHDVFGWDMRYIVFTMPLFAIMSAYGLVNIKAKRAMTVFVLLLVANAAVGYWLIMLYAYPSHSGDIITSFIEVGPGKERKYDEHISYKEAALALGDASPGNATVVSNGCVFVWLYTKRTCYQIEDVEKAPEIVPSLTWAYVMHPWAYASSPGGQMIPSVKQEMTYNNSYVAVYRLTPK